MAASATPPTAPASTNRLAIALVREFLFRRGAVDALEALDTHLVRCSPARPPPPPPLHAPATFRDVCAATRPRAPPQGAAATTRLSSADLVRGLRLTHLAARNEELGACAACGVAVVGAPAPHARSPHPGASRPTVPLGAGAADALRGAPCADRSPAV